MSIIKLKINTKSNKYPILIGSGISSKLLKILNDNSIKFDKCLLVIGNKIPKFLINKIIKSLNNKKKLLLFLMLMKKIKIN